MAELCDNSIFDEVIRKQCERLVDADEMYMKIECIFTDPWSEANCMEKMYRHWRYSKSLVGSIEAPLLLNITPQLRLVRLLRHASEYMYVSSSLQAP